MKYFVIFLGFVMQGCTSVHLKPFESPAPNSSQELRQATYEQYKVSLFTPKQDWFEGLWLTQLSRRMTPILQTQTMEVSSSWVDVRRLEGYYEASGDNESAELVGKANTRRVLGTLTNLTGAGFMGKGLYDIVFEDKQGNTTLSNPWFFSGLVLACGGLWLQYSGAVDYLLPSVESFDHFLRGRLGLAPSAKSVDPPKIQLSWTY